MARRSCGVRNPLRRVSPVCVVRNGEYEGRPKVHQWWRPSYCLTSIPQGIHTHALPDTMPTDSTLVPGHSFHGLRIPCLWNCSTPGRTKGAVATFASFLGFCSDYYMSPASTNVTSHGDGRLDRSEMRSAQTPQTLFKVSRHFPRYPHLEQMLQLAFDSTT